MGHSRKSLFFEVLFILVAVSIKSSKEKFEI